MNSDSLSDEAELGNTFVCLVSLMRSIWRGYDLNPEQLYTCGSDGVILMEVVS